jgi:hypothetical protein
MSPKASSSTKERGTATDTASDKKHRPGSPLRYVVQPEAGVRLPTRAIQRADVCCEPTVDLPLRLGQALPLTLSGDRYLSASFESVQPTILICAA